MQPSADVERYYARVSGRVQGVGFRWFVRHAASLYGVTGWVRNREDGDVDLEAQGKPENVRRFLDAVRAGSRYSDVQGMETRRLDPAEERGFEVADWF